MLFYRDNRLKLTSYDERGFTPLQLAVYFRAHDIIESILINESIKATIDLPTLGISHIVSSLVLTLVNENNHCSFILYYLYLSLSLEELPLSHVLMLRRLIVICSFSY
jgi:hypothetical protein